MEKSRTGWTRRLLTACILIVTALFLASWFVRQMVYPAPAVQVNEPPEWMEELLLSAGGETIAAWHYQSPDASQPVLVYFHGNGENLETMKMSGLYNRLRELNVSFFAIDYPGYGRSSGTPSESTLISSSDAAIEWIEHRYPGQRKLICGWSLGAAVAFQTTARHEDVANGLIAMSAWTTLPQTAKLHFPGWLVQTLLREQYDSQDAATRIRCPALVIHGRQDQLIPASFGLNVSRSLAGAQWVEIPTAGHNDLLDRSTVWKEVAAFVQRFRAPKP